MKCNTNNYNHEDRQKEANQLLHTLGYKYCKGKVRDYKVTLRLPGADTTKIRGREDIKRQRQKTITVIT